MGYNGGRTKGTEGIFVEILPIAEIRCKFSSKVGLPRQGGYAPGLRGTIIFMPEYRIKKATEGLELQDLCRSEGEVQMV